MRGRVYRASIDGEQAAMARDGGFIRADRRSDESADSGHRRGSDGNLAGLGDNLLDQGRE